MGRTDDHKKVELFLDSGAYSAWTQNVEIDIQKYIKFIKKNKKYLTIYANLDVISINGKPPNKATAEATLKNQKIMEKAGLNPLPCFHYGEPFSYLEYYVENYDYIALGVAGNSGVKLIPWLDECFLRFICNKKGLPKVKVHGFAVTSLKLMLRYPWYSVDSTSWILTGRMGSIFVPQWKDGKWEYMENSKKIAVSNASPSMKKPGAHITTLSPKNKEIILKYIHEKGYVLGESTFRTEPQDYELEENEKWAEKKPENKEDVRTVETIVVAGISNRYQLRDEMNIMYFLDLEKMMQQWPWKFKASKSFNLF